MLGSPDRPVGPDSPAPVIPTGSEPVSPDVRALTLAERAADASLVAGLVVGDEDAALAFVRRFQSAVYGLAMSITRDPQTAEDVAQEAFLRAWRAAASYDPRKASVMTWLLTITRNAAIDATRVRRPSPADHEMLDMLLVDVRPDREVDDEALRGIDRARAVASLRSLPEDQARAVVMAVIGGLTTAEISTREQIPLGTAKSRLRLGLDKLRNAWEEDRHG